MPDWLTHVLVAYALATALSVRFDWLDARFVTLAMAGALVPDLDKAELVLPAEVVTATVGLPFDWAAFHTVGVTAIVLLALVGAFPTRYRRRCALALALGAASHFALDLALTTGPGATYPPLWPLSARRTPLPELTSSADPRLALGAAVLALLVWYARSRTRSGSPSGPVAELAR